MLGTRLDAILNPPLTEMALKPDTRELKGYNAMVEMAKKHCMKNCQFIKANQSFLFRGFKESNISLLDNTPGLVYLHGDQTGRVSANTANYYTLFMDNLDSWQYYPKRSRSYICSTSAMRAGTYGNVFYMIPFDEVRIAKCPEWDIWESFESLAQFDVHWMNGMDWLLNALSEAIMGQPGFPARPLPDKSWASLSKRLDEMSSYLKDRDMDEILKKRLTGLMKALCDRCMEWTDGDLISFFSMLMDPESNGFDIGEYPDIMPTETTLGIGSHESNEMWFSGPALALVMHHDKNIKEIDIEKFLEDVVS